MLNFVTSHDVDGSDGRWPEVVDRATWLEARRALLAREKELMRQQDALNAERRRLPMVEVVEPYTFEGPDGRVTLLDLFDGRPQLVVHHVMWAEDWEVPCSSCATQLDGIGHLRQLHVRNTTLVAISLAPYARLAAFRERMGWTIPWYSSGGTSFNVDFHVTLDERVAPVLFGFQAEAELAARGTPWTPEMRGEWPAISAFLRVGDRVFHTYSTFGRGIEATWGGAPYLDMTALGRQDAWEEPAGRAVPLGLDAGGPNLRLPDEYDGLDGADGRA
jgi:predicted dithiol-disulfide oxidoreductase (DUF899 family)